MTSTSLVQLSTRRGRCSKRGVQEQNLTNGGRVRPGSRWGHRRTSRNPVQPLRRSYWISPRLPDRPISLERPPCRVSARTTAGNRRSAAFRRMRGIAAPLLPHDSGHTAATPKNCHIRTPRQTQNPILLCGLLENVIDGATNARSLWSTRFCLLAIVPGDCLIGKLRMPLIAECKRSRQSVQTLAASLRPLRSMAENELSAFADAIGAAWELVATVQPYIAIEQNNTPHWCHYLTLIRPPSITPRRTGGSKCP